MVPSTVFPFLRRDRRANSPARRAPPLPLPPRPPKDSNPPQLPVTPQTPTLTDSLIESGLWAESASKAQSLTDKPSKPELNQDAARPPVSASSASRSFSSYENDSKSDSPRIIVNSRIIPHPDHHEKPSSPWRLSMGKNILGDGGKDGSGLGKGKGKGKGSYNPAFRSSTGNLRVMEGQSSSKRHSTQEGIIPQPRSGKTKLNLLNPLNLLARRRSGQFLSSKSDSARLGLPELPDDYDPRIRGKVVHDFSSPRPRSYVSNSTTNLHQQQCNRGINGQENVASTGFVGGNMLERQRNTFQPGQHYNAHVESSDVAVEDRKPTSQGSESVPAPVPEEGAFGQVASAETEQEQFTSIPPAADGVQTSQSNPLSRSSTMREGSCGLRHLHSVASRFSFDMAGVESVSQEKLLEEKHKEKEAARKANMQQTRFHDSDSDEFDYDAMMDDDGLEEKIPGVNADDEGYDDESGFSSHAHPLNTMNRQFMPVLSPLISNPVSPMDLNSAQPSPGPWQQNTALSENNPFTAPGLQVGAQGQQDVQISPDADVLAPPLLQTSDKGQSRQVFTEDDFYYDDGMFDEVMDGIPGGDEPFDESIFDDPNGPLYERKVRVNPEYNDKALPPVPEVEDPESDRRYSIGRNEDFDHVPKKKTTPPSQILQGEGLTLDNLSAFHTALADVANQAALAEKLERSASGSEASIDQGSSPQTSESQPDLVSDETRTSQKVDSMMFDDVFDDFDYNDMDGMEDDAIIAAANAEALENDDEGIYGQEFGFYAYANGQCDGERVFGGYFGPRAQGIHRSHSGRANFQEPSLTPITERSEWSTRNSVVSLAAHQANSNPSLSSPAFAQIMDGMGSIEDEFTALRKLRRGAFGGSNGSLRSAPSPTAASSPQGPHLSSPLGLSSSVLDDSPAELPRPKSWMLSSNTPGDGASFPFNSIPDSNGSPAALRVNKGDGRRVSIPPPLSVDTVRANTGTVGARRSASYAT